MGLESEFFFVLFDDTFINSSITQKFKPMQKSIKLALGIVFAFALCMTTSCKKIDDITNPTKYGRIQGIVTNYTTGEPLQGVNISLSPSGLSAVTGSDGRYEFNDIEVGQYTVQGM